MRNNIISKAEKFYIQNRSDKTLKIFPYYEKIDYYTTYDIHTCLKHAHKYFFKEISLYIFESIGIKNCLFFFNKIVIQKFCDYKKNILNNVVIDYFEITPYKKIGTICISYDIITYLIEHIFGGKDLNYCSKILSKNVTLFEVNIIKKFFSLILKKYSFLWNKTLFCKIKFNLNHSKNIDRMFNSTLVSDDDIFTNFLLQMKIGKVSGALNISFPIEVFHVLKNECKKKNVSYNYYTSNDKEKRKFFQLIVNNCKIILKIVLVERFFVFSKILKLKVGDILPICKPDNAVAYADDIPILFGKYKIFKKQYVLFFTDFVT